MIIYKPNIFSLELWRQCWYTYYVVYIWIRSATLVNHTDFEIQTTKNKAGDKKLKTLHSSN